MITIQNATVLYGENLEARRANVLIQDEEIVEVSEGINKGRIIDAKGCIVAPALINSHVHLGDSVAKDVGDGEPIDKIVKPPNGLKHQILRETPPEIIVDSMQESMQDMLQTGTTTFVDFREGGLEGIDLLDEASEGLSIRKIVLGRHESFLPHGPESFLKPYKDPAQIEETVQKLLNSCDGIAPSGLGEINDDLACIITETCKRVGKLSAIHVAEYEKVQRDSLKATGKSEVERALNAGFDLLVHLTAPVKDDLKQVADKGVSVVSCPRSNGTLAVGIPPLKEMFDASINLLLGTDNIMFNSPNLLREMEYALKVTRGFYKEYFPPVEILKMATVNAAQALNLNLGSVEEGKIADIMIVEQISRDPVLSIINRTEARNITGLITEGRIIYQR
jgi:cytosine/adenosine deaminase-related metal-dependent hydrolase